MAEQLAILLSKGWLDPSVLAVSRSTSAAEPTSTQKGTSPGRTVVFLRIPKNASTSVVSTLRSLGLDAIVGGHNESLELCGGSAEKLQAFQGLCGGNGTVIDTSRLSSIAAATRIGLGAAAYDASFVFAFARNPFDRCVSSWMYTYSWKLPFPEFVELLAARGLDDPAWTWHERVHLCAQRPHLSLGAEGAPTPAFVGRTEDLAGGIAEVCRRLGVAPPAGALPHENKQERADYRSYYTDRTRDLVGQVYRQDIDYFGYEF
jgi:hypothetical protein